MVNDGIDVVALLSGYWEDWCTLSDGSVDEFFDIFLLSDALILILDDDINFVLDDDDLIEVHDLDGSQVLSCLRLWAWLISSDQKECRIHDGGSRKHGSHEDIVTWAIDKRDVSHEEDWGVTPLAVGCILATRTI